MYGLVTKAFQDMVIQGHGEDAWQRIRKEAGLDDERVISLKNYPDSMTFRLVSAACHQLGAEANSILEAFGEYWVLYTAEEGYGDMLDFTGSTLPELRPPAFSCENEIENSVELIYESSRDGLSPMVTGLLVSLGKRFDKALKVEQTVFKKDGNGPDRFFIQW